jgi:predicted amidohydrolase YtcJ
LKELLGPITPVSIGLLSIIIFAKSPEMSRIVILLISLAVMISSSCNKKETMDLLLYNGRIYTVDQDFTIVQAIAVNNGRIVASGNAEELRKAYRFSLERDLQGAAMYPGFIDAHCHFYGYGLLSETRVDLSGTKSFEEVIARLEDWHKTHSALWIEGRGWDQNDWEIKQFPHKALLDEVFPDIPVLLTRVDGHAMLANGKALEMAGINAATSVKGGEIILRDGEPSGMLIDNAMTLVEGIIPGPDEQLIRKAFLRAQDDCSAFGLTMVADAGLKDEQIRTILALQQEDTLHTRIYAMLTPDRLTLKNWFWNGPTLGEQLIIRSLKAYADGALGSRGALLLDPYSDKPETRGIVVDGWDSIRELATFAYDNNFQLNVHAIGDSAVRGTLDVFEQLLPPGNDLRWRIEHAQVVHPEDISRFANLKVIPSIQATHATSDMYWAAERLGSRVANAYAYKSLLATNGWIPNGTDFPIEQINPIYTFYASVFRKDLEGWPDGGFQPENALSREEALRSITIWAARACFAEQFTGSLEAGKVADFVVLNDDLMTAAEDKVPEIQVKETWVSGKRVY